jgi:ribulose bisphosphate carboxylase small subunit
VLREIDNATKAFPNAYIRMSAFDANRQVQVASMLVHRWVSGSCGEDYIAALFAS